MDDFSFWDNEWAFNPFALNLLKSHIKFKYTDIIKGCSKMCIISQLSLADISLQRQWGGLFSPQPQQEILTFNTTVKTAGCWRPLRDCAKAFSLLWNAFIPQFCKMRPKQLLLLLRISKQLPFLRHKRLRANMHWNDKILKRLWNNNVSSCYICLLLIELLPRMLVLWRIICQCKTSNGPIYWLLQAVEFQQSLINLFRSVSREMQRGELHSRENISSF